MLRPNLYTGLAVPNILNILPEPLPITFLATFNLGHQKMDQFLSSPHGNLWKLWNIRFVETVETASQLPLYLQRRLLMQRVDRLKAGQTSSFSLHPRIHCVRWWKFHRRCTGLPWIPDEDAPDHFTQLSWNIMFYPPCIQLASRYDSLNWIKHTNLHELDVFGNWVKQFSRELINTHKL